MKRPTPHRKPNAPHPEARSTNLSSADFSRIARAIKFARKSRMRTRVGAYVASTGKLTAGACNKERNHPRIDYLQASVHAEIAALRKVPGGAAGATVYVARLGARGRLLPSFPCHRCIPALVSHRIRRVVWWDGEKWVATKISEI